MLQGHFIQFISLRPFVKSVKCCMKKECVKSLTATSIISINNGSFFAVCFILSPESTPGFSLAFTALTLLVGRQEEQPACKNGVMGC